jgi:hypothetical protein
MSQPERLQCSAVSVPTRVRSFAVTQWKALQLSIERRSFESKLETIVRSGLAHQSSGLTAGDQQYKLLSDHANAICAHFSSRWNINPNLLEAQIPAIRKLKSLSDPPPTLVPTALVSLGAVGAVILFFLLGVLAGVANVGYHMMGGR